MTTASVTRALDYLVAVPTEPLNKARVRRGVAYLVALDMPAPPPPSTGSGSVPGPVRLSWRPRVTASEQRVYRSDAAFDLESMPSALAVLAGDASTYLDTEAPAGVLYYAVAAVVDGSPDLIALSAVVVVADG